MAYRNVLILGLGTLFALTALVLPFVGLEGFVGDHRPMIAAMAAAAVGIGCYVFVWRPAMLEAYTKLASLAFFVLMLLGVLGLLAELDTGAVAVGW